MPREKRAAQFAPFDALRGMREALAMSEYEHERKVKGDVSEETAEKISAIINELEKGTIVKAKYFDDGYDKEYIGTIKVDVFEQTVKLHKLGKTIPLDDLLVQCCGFHKVNSSREKTITTSSLNYKESFKEYIQNGWEIDYVPKIIIDKEKLYRIEKNGEKIPLEDYYQINNNGKKLTKSYPYISWIIDNYHEWYNRID